MLIPADYLITTAHLDNSFIAHLFRYSLNQFYFILTSLNSLSICNISLVIKWLGFGTTATCTPPIPLLFIPLVHVTPYPR